MTELTLKRAQCHGHPSAISNTPSKHRNDFRMYLYLYTVNKTASSLHLCSTTLLKQQAQTKACLTTVICPTEHYAFSVILHHDGHLSCLKPVLLVVASTAANQRACNAANIMGKLPPSPATYADQ
jgi:hypothetical protein